MVLQEKEVLDYHEGNSLGKLEVIPSKPCLTQRDLSIAYTPGVAIPCLRIAADPLEGFKYTGRGNLVAVVSNGTAVLGLGNIGALAGKPVMEGKAVLFKRFADVNVFDIELATEDADEIIRTVKLLEPTFGGINLEDIKVPECFYIEETLQREMDIPVFHDDQHGTAIISSAALLNALELANKDISEIKVVAVARHGETRRWPDRSRIINDGRSSRRMSHTAQDLGSADAAQDSTAVHAARGQLSISEACPITDTGIAADSKSANKYPSYGR